MERFESERTAELAGRSDRLRRDLERARAGRDEAVRKREQRDAEVVEAKARVEKLKGRADRCGSLSFWLCVRVALVIAGVLVILGGAGIVVEPGQEAMQMATMHEGFGAEPVPIPLVGEPPQVAAMFAPGLCMFALAIFVAPPVGRPHMDGRVWRWAATLLFAWMSVGMIGGVGQSAAPGMALEHIQALGSTLSGRANFMLACAVAVWIGLGLYQSSLKDQVAAAQEQESEACARALGASLTEASANKTLRGASERLKVVEGELASISDKQDEARRALERDEQLICGLTELRAHLDRMTRLHEAGSTASALEPIALIGHAGTGKTWSRLYISRTCYLAGIMPTWHAVKLDLADCGSSGCRPADVVRVCDENSDSLFAIDCTGYVPATDEDSSAASANRRMLREACEIIRAVRTKLPCVLIVVECRTECADEIMRGLSDAKGPLVRPKNRLRCEDLSSSDLLHLLIQGAGKGKVVLDRDAEEAMRAGFDAIRRVQGGRFANAHILERFVRDLVTSSIELGAGIAPGGARVVTEDVVRDALADEEWGQVRVSDADRKPVRDAAMAELNGLIGLGSVKQTFATFETTLQFERKLAEARGEADAHAQGRKPSFAFLGPAGTGKTTVARLMARLLYGIGICDTPKLVVTNPNDLIAGYVGQSGPNTRAKLEEARGGVLFVDEAYNLQSGGSNSHSGDFADAVIAELLTAMTSDDSNVVLVFAGYEDSMKKFFDSNEGIRSRITNTVRFESYTSEELAQIVEAKLAKMGFEVVPESHGLLVRLAAHISTLGEEYANARGAEKVADEIKAEKARQWQADQANDDVLRIGPEVVEAVLRAHVNGV